MKSDTILDAIGMIDEEAIRDAREYRCDKTTFWSKKWIATAAGIVLCFSLSVPVLAATVPGFYQMLYSISPSTAQFFKPVQMISEDNGIRMEVLATYIHEDTAEVFVAMQDLEGGRIDDTTDLFDSYSINTPYSCIGHCQKVSYEQETQTVTFLITIEQLEKQNIEGEKITFSVREFISNKHKFSEIVSDVELSHAEPEPMTQSVSPRGKSYSAGYTEDMIPNIALKSEEIIASPMSGVTITGVGYVGNNLHIQAYYENIFETDNHGWVELRNKDTGETVSCMGSLGFFDEERSGSYEDYIFTDIEFDDLQKYELYGEFVTSGNHIQGNWSVTFPLH